MLSRNADKKGASQKAVLVTQNPGLKDNATLKVTKNLWFANKGNLTTYQIVGNDLFFLYIAATGDGVTNSTQAVALCQTVKVNYIRMYDETTTDSNLAVTFNSTRTNKTRVIQPAASTSYVSDTGKVKPPRSSLIKDPLVAGTDGALNVAFLSGLSPTTVICLNVTIELPDSYTTINPDVVVTATLVAAQTVAGVWRGRLNSLGNVTNGIEPLGYALSGAPIISSIP